MLSRLIAVALAGAAFATTYAVAQPATSGIRFKQIHQDTVVNADGRRAMTSTSQIQVLTAAMATQFAQIPVRYEGTIQDVEVLEAYTLKADGRKLTVDPANIITQKMPQANALVPIYSDAEQKIVIFPNVEAGDTLFLTSRTSDKIALMPGQFVFSAHLPRAIEADDSIYTVTAPKTMHMTAASHEVTQDVTDHGDTATYRWSFSNPTPVATPVRLVADPDSGAYFTVSSMKDYDVFAHVIGALIRPKVTVTPEIQKQADTITAGIADRKEQARAIYDWVNQHVRYVAIDFGNGGFIPHDPNWTLNNAFGDGKDQAVLFASLLKARNIPAELVAIHAGNRYKLSGLPTSIDFNHMIVYLPDWKIYADTTVPGTPFQMLPVTEYGKPVVHLVETGPAQHRTPVLPPDLVSSTYKVHAVENSDGRFEVQVTTSATGPWAGSLRRLADTIQMAGPTGAASGLLKAHNFPNATGTLTPAPNGTAAGAVAINGNFHTAGILIGGNVNALARGLQLMNRAGDGPLGPLGNTTITASDETPCYSGRQVEDIDFQFTNGDHLAAVPSDTHIHTGNIAYDTKWTVSGNTVSLHREFVAKVTEPTCSGKVREDAAGALAKIRADYEQQAKVERPAAKVE
jgi:transglutaminase-like putative cysteine protease